MGTNSKHFSIAIKQEILNFFYGHIYYIFDLGAFKMSEPGQGYAYFDCEYFVMVIDLVSTNSDKYYGYLHN